MKEQELELRRHIDAWFINWKQKPNHKPALIKGIRQSGKTHAIRKFVYNKSNYEIVVYLNFCSFMCIYLNIIIHYFGKN